MKYFLILFCSLFTIASISAQEFITDDQVATTAVVKDNEMKVLYLTASWCGPCRRMKPGIAKIAADSNTKATIYKMDIDENITDDILGVNSVPTFIFLKNGTVIGQHKGAMSDEDLKILFDKHEAMKPSKTLLAYQPTPSKYEIVSGSHSKLTKKNISKVWHSNVNLDRLALSIHNNLKDSRDLKSGLVLVNRSLELNPNETNVMTLKVSYLKRLGNRTEALATAGKARKLMVSNNQPTDRIDQMIQEMRQQS